jgi:purine-binding chemotaxis protein CheW
MLMSVASINDARQYLTFQLGEGAFALDVSNVREILELGSVTKVPKTPGYMRGVINLRGSVVPVIDMRAKFDLARTEETVDTCIIVVEVDIEQEKNIVGALVDSVQEVVELEPQQIEAAPRMGTQLRTDFIKGMGKKDDSFVIILDIDRVFSSEELAAVLGTEGERETEKAVNE